MRETSSSFPASAGYLVTATNHRTVTLLIWGIPVWKASQLPSTVCYRRYGARSHRGGGDEQTQSPNRAAVRIDSAGDRQHRTLGCATDGAKFLPEDLAENFLKRGQGHDFKMGAKISSRPPHQRKRKIGVRARASFIDQSRFWRKFGFFKQGSDGETRQARGPALHLVICLGQVGDLKSDQMHYQLLNWAGGL
jgi:hypothetical protein